MIIPVKCFTCGEVLADKYRYYMSEVIKRNNKDGIPENKVVYLTKTNVKKSNQAIVMDELMLTKQCCRRHFLTHVDID